MHTTTNPLDKLMFGDFANHSLKRLYLETYNVELIKEREEDRVIFTWPHGFVTLGYWNEFKSEVWAFTFIWYWLRGYGFLRSEELAYNSVKGKK